MIGLLAGAGAAWSAAAGVAGGLERGLSAEFASGQADLEAGRGLLAAGAAGHERRDIVAAQGRFRSARVHFERARALVDSSRAVVAAERAPVLAGYVRPRRDAVDHLADAATAVADAAWSAAGVDLRLVAPDAPGPSGSARLVEVLRASGADVDAIEAHLSRARAAAAAVPAALLPAAQRAAFGRLRSAVETGFRGVAELRRLVPVLVEVLGGSGARTYLIEQVNPAELRPGGGFIGSFSILHVDGGRLELVRSGGSESVDYPRPSRGQPGYVAPPGPLQQLVGEQGWTLGDSNFAPDFPSAAREGERFIEREAHVHVDGVISIDPEAIAALLQVTGPLAVPDYGITVDAATFSEFVFRFENASTRSPHAKRFLSATAVPLVAALGSLPAGRWPQLIGALNAAAAARHLAVYLDSDVAEAEMDRYGWSGRLNPLAAPDFLLEVEANLGATKANRFLRRGYELELSAGSSRLHHRLTVDLGNGTPAGFEGGRTYNGYVRLYLPDGAAGVSLGPVLPARLPAPDPPPGFAVADGWLVIEVDPRRGYGGWRLTLTYDTAWDGGSGSLYWQKQPGTGADRVHVTWSSGGRTSAADGDLGQDRVVRFGPSGVTIGAGRPASATLPSLSL